LKAQAFNFYEVKYGDLKGRDSRIYGTHPCIHPYGAATKKTWCPLKMASCHFSWTGTHHKTT